MKILRFLAAIFTVLFAVPSVFAEAKKEINENYEYQNAHLAKLEEFYSEYTPADENSFCAFDLDEALNNGVKFNEVSFIATHNSYERQGCDAYKKVYSKLSALTFGIVSESRPEFESENLTDQFEAGIRSVELDVETKDENGNVINGSGAEMVNPPELCAYGTGTLMVAKALQRPEFGDPKFAADAKAAGAKAFA